MGVKDADRQGATRENVKTEQEGQIETKKSERKEIESKIKRKEAEENIWRRNRIKKGTEIEEVIK